MKNTLRGKLVIGTIVSVILINVIFTVFISLFLENNLKNSIINEMKNIKNYSVDTIKQNTIIEASKWDTLKEIQRMSKVYVAMADEDREISEELNTNINEEEIKNILNESKSIRSIIKFKKLDNVYCVTYNYPVYLKDQFYCNLIIQKDYIDKYNENNNLIAMIIGGQVLVVITLIVVISCIIKKVIEPMKKLSTSMENFIHHKEINDIVIESNDEVGQLAKSYNLMKNELKSQMDIIIEEKNKVDNLQKTTRDFFNNATHELKTPLTSILLYAQLLHEDSIKNIDEDFIYRSTERIVLESEKMKALVEKILNVSKGRVNSKKYKSNFSLSEIVKELIEDFEIRLEREDLYIKDNIEEIQCVAVLDDIEQIISNLIDNAIKYSTGKEININLYNTDNYINFEIRNKCGYIPEEIRSRLLEPFIKYNTFEDIEKEVSSSGLGLYLCSELAKENNGELTYKINKDNIIFNFRLNI